MRPSNSTVDVAVVGFNLAGFAAATEASKAGGTVALLDYPSDTAVMPDRARITGLPHLPQMPPENLELYLIERAKVSGIRLVSPNIESLLSDEAVSRRESRELPIFVDDITGASFEARKVIFAPCGSAPPIDTEIARFFSRGLSTSAWSDRSAVTGGTVVVAGDGPYTYDQALLLADVGLAVTALLEGHSGLPPEPLQGDVEAAGIAFHAGCRVVGASAGPDGNLSEINVMRNGTCVKHQTRWLFAAYQPVVDWTFWIDQARAYSLVDQGYLFLTGLAAELPFGDYAAEWAHGVETARRCLVS